MQKVSLQTRRRVQSYLLRSKTLSCAPLLSQQSAYTRVSFPVYSLFTLSPRVWLLEATGPLANASLVGPCKDD